MITLSSHDKIRYAVRKLGANKVLSELNVLGAQISPRSAYESFFDSLKVPKHLSENEYYLLQIKCKS